MRREQIAECGMAVDCGAGDVRNGLPADFGRCATSEQPLEVLKRLDLFMRRLEEPSILLALVGSV